MAVTNKFSAGVFLGATSETLTSDNINLWQLKEEDIGKAPKDSETQTIGLFSRGFGVVFSRDKLAIGAFMGWVTGFGSLSKAWHYENLLWIGAGVGYDLFKL